MNSHTKYLRKICKQWTVVQRGDGTDKGDYMIVKTIEEVGSTLSPIRVLLSHVLIEKNRIAPIFRYRAEARQWKKDNCNWTSNYNSWSQQCDDY